MTETTKFCVKISCFIADIKKQHWFINDPHLYCVFILVAFSFHNFFFFYQMCWLCESDICSKLIELQHSWIFTTASFRLCSFSWSLRIITCHTVRDPNKVLAEFYNSLYNNVGSPWWIIRRQSSNHRPAMKENDYILLISSISVSQL